MAGGPPPAWGWYRLDRSWAERLVAESGVRRGDLVLDVGAGDGALTAPLLAAGARVIAIELHPGRAAGLVAKTVDNAAAQVTLACLGDPTARSTGVVMTAIGAALAVRAFRSSASQRHGRSQPFRRSP